MMVSVVNRVACLDGHYRLKGNKCKHLQRSMLQSYDKPDFLADGKGLGLVLTIPVDALGYAIFARSCRKQVAGSTANVVICMADVVNEPVALKKGGFCGPSNVRTRPTSSVVVRRSLLYQFSYPGTR